MNPRRVATTAAALFGTVILVGGVIAVVAGFEMGEARVSDADAVSAAAAVTAITKAALPDGSQQSAAETVPAHLAAVSASDLAHTKAAGTLDESLPDSLQALEREAPPVQVATANTSDLVDSGAKEAASAATLDEQLPDSSQALVPETPPDGKEALDECLTSEACIDQYLWSVYQRAPKEDATKVVERTKAIVKTNGKPQTVVKEMTRLVDEDFAWKDPKAAEKAGMSLMEYVIGGMDRDFKLKLYHALRAMDDAGLSPGITSAFRDDYRQSLASGLKAATNRSYPVTAAERIRNTRDRKPKRAIYSLFATIIILRNSQKPRDRRIFDRLDMTAQSTVATRRWGVPAIVTLAAMAALAAPTADAAARQSRPAPTTEATAPREAGEPIMAIVSIMSQQVTFYDADGWILRAPVSTGTTGRETPAGVFAIIEKDKDHHSTLYDDAWMPNMQRITWNGIALHGGPLPGHAASHGCVRMPYDFAEKLFDKTWIGMRVIISPNDAAPVEFSHPALFVPNAEAVAAAPTRAETLAREAAEAAKTADEAKKAAATAAREAASLTASLRKLEWLKPRADAELAFADKALAAAKTDQAKARAEELKQKAAANAAEAGTQLDRAKADAKSKLDAAAAAKEAAKAAEIKKAAAAKAASESKLALEPVSVYISRATQKLYVRRNTHKPWPDGGEVFDTTIEVPVTIRNPDKPFGTHVFTAMARNDVGLRWTAVTIDNGDDAKDALDRITIPQDVLDRIAPTALPRSSIIVSDEPLSRETNYRTEFVAVLNNQPQGGFLVRRPTVAVPVASGNFWGNDVFGSFFQGNWNSQPTNTRPRAGQYYQPMQQRWW